MDITPLGATMLPDGDTDMLKLSISPSYRSSVSLNTLLSGYLSELQQLAEGDFMPATGPRHLADAKTTEHMAPEPTELLQGMFLQTIESFPISSCNSWGLPALSADAPKLEQTAEDWIARIAQPPQARPDAISNAASKAASRIVASAVTASARGPSALSHMTRAVPPPFPTITEVSSGEGERLVTPSSPSSALPGVSAPAKLGGANPTPPSVLLPTRMPALFGRAELPGSHVEPAQVTHQPVQQRWPVPRLNRSGAADSGGVASPMTTDSAVDSANTEDQAGLDLCGGPRGSKRSKEEVQKRNKEAQQRFRDRQKARVKELEDQVEELIAKLDAADRERQTLERRLAEFSHTLAERDELIARLRADAAAVLGSGPGVARYSCNLVLTVYPGRQIKLTSDEVAKLSREDMVKLWKEYVSALSNLLPSGQAELGQAAADKVQHLINEATALLLCVADASPAMFKTVAACKLEPRATQHGDDSLRLWTAVTASLALTEQQRAYLAQLRSVCLTALAGIIDERNAIHANLTAAMPAAVGARHTAAQYLKAHEGIEQLKLNLKKEHDLKVDWMTAIFAHALTPMQVGRVIVHSYPWLPDTMAVAAVVAAEAGDSAALSHLCADDSGGPGAFLAPRNEGLAAPRGDSMPEATRKAPPLPPRGGSLKRLSVPTPFAEQQPEPGSTITSGDDF